MSNDATHIEPREDWYARGDVITMFVDEGTRVEQPLRDAQLCVLREETRSLQMLSVGQDATGHRSEPGPYQWTVKLLSQDDIDEWTLTEDPENPDPLIARASGGDSVGFGYDWHYVEKKDVIYMTEDPKVRIPVLSTVADALADARTGLLDLVQRLNEAKAANS